VCAAKNRGVKNAGLTAYPKPNGVPRLAYSWFRKRVLMVTYRTCRSEPETSVNSGLTSRVQSSTSLGSGQSGSLRIFSTRPFQPSISAA
jgi:hypothetical protein